jgi:hypothetical protein
MWFIIPIGHPDAHTAFMRELRQYDIKFHTGVAIGDNWEKDRKRVIERWKIIRKLDKECEVFVVMSDGKVPPGTYHPQQIILEVPSEGCTRFMKILTKTIKRD